MDHILDIFNDDAFSMVSLTEAINLVPNTFGRIGDMGLFNPEPVDTYSVAIEEENGVLSIIPAQLRGGPAAKNKRAKRSLKQVGIPHFPIEDQILIAEIRGVRGLGRPLQLETLQTKVNRVLMNLRRKHDITLEWLRAGAIRGKIMDADGSTLLDIFDLMGVTEKTVDFDLGDDTTDIVAKSAEVKDHIELNLLGDSMTGVHALCSRSWFNKFVKHPDVADHYNRWSGTSPRREDLSKNFEHQGITYEVYVGSAPDKDGNQRKFIADGDVRFIPLGTTDTFTQYNAPSTMDDGSAGGGLMGQPFYASQEIMDHNKGVEIFTESDPLPFVRRPQVLVRGYSST